MNKLPGPGWPGECCVLRGLPKFLGGAGGNRTPVRQVVVNRATTIPALRPQGHHTGGSADPKVYPQVYFLASAVFHAVSGLSQLSTLTSVAGL